MVAAVIRFYLVLGVLALLPLKVLAEGGPAQRLAAAVQLRTVSHQDPAQQDLAEFQRFREFLVATYPRVFGELQVEWVGDYSLLLRWPGSDPAAGAVLFTAHYDVVPVEPGTEGDWTHPPFEGVIADGRVYGRGTLDDKQGVISLLESVGLLLAEDFRPRKTIVVAIGHDEEVGGARGAAQLAARMRQLGLHFDWMVDEGGMVIADHPLLPERPLALVNVAEKGYLTLTLSTTGPGGHSSQPPEDNSILRLARALDRLDRQPFGPELPDPVRAMFEAIAPYTSLGTNMAFSNLWLTEGLVARMMAGDPSARAMVRTTTALTMFNAGVKENVVPQRAEAKVNFRLLPGYTVEQVIDHVTRAIDDPAVTVSAGSWGAIPPVADHRAEGFELIAAALATVYPEAVVAPGLLPGATDTRHYIDLADNHYRFHGTWMEMQQLGGIHGTDEYIGIDSFENTVAIAVQLMREGSR